MQEDAKENSDQSDKKLAELRAEDQRLEAEIAALEGDSPKVVPDKGGFRISNSKKKEIQFINSKKLICADLPPIMYLVSGMLSEGLGGLSAKSKLGKSWMSLQLAVAITLGEPFLGFQTKKSGALYIDLENSPSLSQERLRTVLDGREPPDDLYFVYDFNLIGKGFEEDMEKFLFEHPEVKLIIIDVLQKVKPQKKKNQTDYEADYEVLTILKTIAEKYRVCIMPIYHDRKAVDPTDPFANMLGSTALMGTSDFIWNLYKEERKSPEATLAITGRTVKDAQYKVRRVGALWQNLGDAAAIEEARKRQEYDNDPVVNTIKRLVEKGHGKWEGIVKELITSSQYFKGCRIYGSAQKVGHQITKREKQLAEYDSIVHYAKSNGNAGQIHVFESDNPFVR